MKPGWVSNGKYNSWLAANTIGPVSAVEPPSWIVAVTADIATIANL